MFVTKPYSDPCCYDNNMTKTGLWQEIFLMMLLLEPHKNFLHMNISWITELNIKAEIKENIEDSSLI